MKPNMNIIKWLIGLLALALFISFGITLPNVSAQEGALPVPTATPTGTLVPETEEPSIPTATPTETEGSAFFPIATPTAFTEETPLQPQEAERQVAPSQAMQEANAYLESVWPAFNVSDTDYISVDPSIAVDLAGNIHMVWAEAQSQLEFQSQAQRGCSARRIFQ